ncbi:MAG: class I SAM-dependent methyltransferase [Candidatus Bathyarchaeales archaeon]
MPTSPCIKIHKPMGEKTVALLKQLNLFNRELKIEQKNNSLYIPLSRKPTVNELKKLRKTLETVEVAVHDFNAKKLQPKTFVDLLEKEMPPHLSSSLPRAVDFVGDIAIIEVHTELSEYKKKIGQAIMATNKRVRTVLAKTSPIKGVHRTREFEPIAGEAKTATVHKENGCVFYVDLFKAYFSPRLSNEHARIANMVNEGEIVIDMFSGVGPFAIQIAKQHKNVHVYAVDVNPEAIELLNRNIAANRVADKVTAILGDVRQVVHDRLNGNADRVLMNLPEKAIEYVDAACRAIKPTGGIIHYYEFANARTSKTSELRLIEAVEKTKRRVAKVLLSKTVRATAPYTWQVVVDARIK